MAHTIFLRSIGIALAAVLFSCAKTEEAKKADDTQIQPETRERETVEVELNEAQYSASDIELGTFSPKNLSEVVNANGYTKLPPQNQADVSVFVSGNIKSIVVIEGQNVRKGQVIATVESPEFTRIQQEFLTSRSNLEFLRLEFDRQRILSEEEVSAKKVFQKTKAEFEIEKTRFASLKKQLQTMNINPNSGPVATVPVVAPISGSVTEVNIKIGSNVTPGTPLVSIVDNSQLHVDLLVYEKDLQKVKTGQSVRFVLTNQDNTEIKGKVFSVGKAFENETKSVAVHADIENEKQRLIPGMYVNALIDVGAHTVNALPVEAIVNAEGREFIFILEQVRETASDPKKETAHDQKQGHAHDDGHAHEESGKSYHFARVEVKTGTAQLGYVQATPLQQLAPDAKIVLKGAYYIQSHLLKNRGQGGHAH
ncbi:efflux RND transporter periplasmic adaptor subunit [Flavobacterium selenitireducens]|uniref:efflux RND transporter periplasmic adaptor subunit n=1 Tax=Flavobacterium selenitireducens TaxID=2722704 RepID=UPI00168A9915|nr:efflux RND transporter periplasmic adaptor subunit [Flavobacterium selenitireducens]MBD3581902.1 efflux RND transporter periplasmic adaptor subunit [Flavobacterium selenitireducens]